MPEWGFFLRSTAAASDVAAADDHRGPWRGQLWRGGPTEPRRRAGDHRNFAFQIPANSGHSSTSVLICLIIDRQREL